MNRCNLCNHHPCHCDETVPVNPVDLFGSPYDCRKQLRTRRFSSPNSAFPQEQLDDLQVCIEAINHILRSLGSESNLNNTRQLQLHFLDLKGISVKANFLCEFQLDIDDNLENEEFVEFDNNMEADHEDLEETIISKNKRNRKNESKDHALTKCNRIICKTGKLATAGTDFVQINPVGSALFVLYSKLIAIARHKFDEEERDPKFINADQETRRELAFNFGEFVSKNIDIENLFFGVPLYKAINKYVGKEVKVRSAEGLITGTLIETKEGRIKILNQKFNKEIDIDSICYLQVLNLK